MALEYTDISSKYRRPRNLDRELIAFRRLMRKRNHKKRHSVNKEKSHTDRQKAARAKKKCAANTANGLRVLGWGIDSLFALMACALVLYGTVMVALKRRELGVAAGGR